MSADAADAADAAAAVLAWAAVASVWSKLACTDRTRTAYTQGGVGKRR
jgi:hypothetical protein